MRTCRVEKVGSKKMGRWKLTKAVDSENEVESAKERVAKAVTRD